MEGLQKYVKRIAHTLFATFRIILIKGAQITLVVKKWIARNTIIGDVNNRLLVHPIVLDDPIFGKSTTYPIALEIIIDKKSRNPIPAGSLANSIFFADFPRLYFTVCFSCGKSGLFKQGVYTNPFSHWFNVFFGYYQIDAPCKQWSAPFGYKIFTDRHRLIDADHFVRIGKADWNYFSNYMYGVPNQHIIPYNNYTTPECIIHAGIGKNGTKIGDKYWDTIELEGFTVVSAYCANGREDLRLNSPLFTPMWQLSFGNPHPLSQLPVSFFGVRMKAVFYLYSSRGHDLESNQEVWQTAMFGGTINMDYPSLNAKSPAHKIQLETFNNGFLQAQLKASQKRILQDYPNLGYCEQTPKYHSKSFATKQRVNI